MDSGDELIILRVVTVDMTGKCRARRANFGGLLLTYVCLVDKRSNVQALLHHEENKARENANAVLNKVLDKESDIEVSKDYFKSCFTSNAYMVSLFQISVVIEFVIGKVQETIQHMVRILHGLISEL